MRIFFIIVKKVPKDLVVHKRNIHRLLERVHLDAINGKTLMKYYNQMMSEGLYELRIVICLNHLLVSSRIDSRSFFLTSTNSSLLIMIHSKKDQYHARFQLPQS